MSFREEYKTLQELVRELLLLRKHNGALKEANSQEKLLLFAEAALVLMTLERFLRILPGVNATDKETLPVLLQRAVAIRQLTLPPPQDMTVVDRVRKFRNSLLHANYEQAVKKSGAKNVEDYFKTQFAPELEFLFQLTNELVAQIDPETGFRLVPV